MDHGPFKTREVVQMIVRWEVEGQHMIQDIETGIRVKLRESDDFKEIVERARVAKVKHEDFPFVLRNEKTDFIECIRSRSQTLEGAEVGHRASTMLQMAYIARLLGRKLTWDPVTEQFPGDDEANNLVQGKPGLAPWTIQ